MGKIKPHFKHDCKVCTYLGSDESHDFYHCYKTLGTVIARRGNEPDNYCSGIHSARAMANHPAFANDPLVKALNLAIEKGFVGRDYHLRQPLP